MKSDFIYVSSDEGDFARIDEEELQLVACTDPTETTLFDLSSMDKCQSMCDFLNSHHPANWRMTIVADHDKTKMN